MDVSAASIHSVMNLAINEAGEDAMKAGLICLLAYLVLAYRHSGITDIETISEGAHLAMLNMGDWMREGGMTMDGKNPL